MSKQSRMSGLRNNLIFIAAALGVLGLLYAISGERSNRIPEDRTHMIEAGPEACLQCHGPGMIHPRSAKHPPKDDCMKCHKRKRGAKTIKATDGASPATELKAMENAPVANSAAPSNPQQ